MALVAFSLNENRLLIAIARNIAGKLSLQQTLIVDLDADLDPTTDAGRSILRDKIRRLMQSTGISKGDATVVVSREQIEMRQFSVPIVPDEELPDLVRFQARSHFTALNDNWSLDYVPIAKSGNSLTVLASAISPDQVSMIRKIVEPSGLKLRHIVLRPFSAAELLHVRAPDPGCRLVVEVIGKQADVSVVVNNYVVLTRTIRVPETYTEEQFNTWLPGEIRRTMAAARNQTAAPEIEKIVIVGGQKQHQDLKQELEQLQLNVELFPPFDAIALGKKVERPKSADGYASLIGSLLQQTASSSHALDFLNPRKKPAPKGRRQRITIAAVAAAAVFIIAVGICWIILNGKDRQIAQLDEDIRRVEAKLKTADGTPADILIARVGMIDQWKRGDTVWIEELSELSQRMPMPDEAMVGSFTGRIRSSAEATQIEMTGYLLDHAAYDELVDNLADRPYRVPPGTVKDLNSALYSKSLTLNVFLPFPTIDELDAELRPRPTTVAPTSEELTDTQPPPAEPNESSDSSGQLP